jgi:hypothetical protein
MAIEYKPQRIASCKLGEKGCFKDGRCYVVGDCVNQVVTNADKIRAMTDDELADWIARTQIANVVEALSVAKIPYEITDDMHDAVKKECFEWLRQPAEVSE